MLRSLVLIRCFTVCAPDFVQEVKILSELGFSTFLPTIINDLGKWTTAEVQLLTIPCYFLGAVTYMSTAFLSDRMQRRGLFCVIFGTLSVIGYAILLSDSPSGVHYFGCFLVAGGLYVVVGLPLAWVSGGDDDDYWA